MMGIPRSEFPTVLKATNTILDAVGLDQDAGAEPAA